MPRAGLPTTPLSFLTLSAPGARGTTQDPRRGPLHPALLSWTYRERGGSDRREAGAIPRGTALGHLPQSSSEARGWSPSCLHGVHMDDTCPCEPSPHPRPSPSRPLRPALLRYLVNKSFPRVNLHLKLLLGMAESALSQPLLERAPRQPPIECGLASWLDLLPTSRTWQHVGTQLCD